jgi:GcrA cell cycle regulator
MGWTDERVEILKRLWLEGLSASQIAKQLGGVTRNAVIGKVHRLGLSGRATPSQPSRPAFRAPRPARPMMTSPAARRPARRAPARPLHRRAGHSHGPDAGRAHVQMADW